MVNLLSYTLGNKQKIWVDFQKSFQVGFDTKIDKLYIGRFGQVLVESFFCGINHFSCYFVIDVTPKKRETMRALSFLSTAVYKQIVRPHEKMLLAAAGSAVHNVCVRSTHF